MVLSDRAPVLSQVPLNVEAEDPEEWRREEQEKIDSSETLSEEEQQEKERLLNEVCVNCVWQGGVSV